MTYQSANNNYSSKKEYSSKACSISDSDKSSCSKGACKGTCISVEVCSCK